MTSAERKLRAFAATLPHFERQEALQIIKAGAAAIRVPVVFRYLGQDWDLKEAFEIGREGEPLRTFRTGLRGVWWVWAAINDQGRHNVLRVCDFSAPGTDPISAAKSASKAIRRTAPDYFARVAPDLPELAAAARSISIEDGMIRYHPRSSSPRFSTE